MRHLIDPRTLIAVLLMAFAPAVAQPGQDSPLSAPSYGNLHGTRLGEHFPGLASMLVEGHVVPGLHENFVPQGVDNLGVQDGEAVISGYFCRRFTAWYQSLFERCARKRSALYLMDMTTGEAKRLALLSNADGTPMRRHAGGVAELHDRLWVSDRFEVHRFSLARLREATSPVIELRPDNALRIGVDASGDFITAHKDMLWIGNFERGRRGQALPGHYIAPEHGTRGWTAGYHIDPDTLRPMKTTRYTVTVKGTRHRVHRPDAALHHRDKVQGLAFLDDRHVVLSTSYGPSRGALTFHALPFAPMSAAIVGPKVLLPDRTDLVVQPLSRLTEKTLIPTPPGTEGVSWNQDNLAVAFEGGARPYRNRWFWKEDRLMRLRLPLEDWSG